MHATPQAPRRNETHIALGAQKLSGRLYLPDDAKGLVLLMHGRHIQAHKELIVVPGATHLFEESQTLKKASQCALRWFTRYLAPAQEHLGAEMAS